MEEKSKLNKDNLLLACWLKQNKNSIVLIGIETGPIEVFRDDVVIFKKNKKLKQQQKN